MKLLKQYEYAVDTLDSIEKVLNSTSRTSSEQLNDPNFDWQQWVYRMVKRTLIFVLLIKCFNYMIDSKIAGDPFGMQDRLSKFDFKKATDIDQRLSDIKGIDEISEEVQDLISMIKEPQKYWSKGAKIPKGVLLFGEPGTGKTLLARAIAGESGANFIFCSGSDFDEMFVGVGAKRVRQLFKEARKESPCIIFIDEIDSLLGGGRRNGDGNSSASATINQMLAEMDGF